MKIKVTLDYQPRDFQTEQLTEEDVNRLSAFGKDGAENPGLVIQRDLNLHPGPSAGGLSPSPTWRGEWPSSRRDWTGSPSAPGGLAFGFSGQQRPPPRRFW